MSMLLCIIVTIVGTLVFAWLFDQLAAFICYLFSDKRTTDMAEVSRIKWYERIKWFR